MQWQSLLKDLMTTGEEINEEGEVVLITQEPYRFPCDFRILNRLPKKTVTNKTSVEFTRDLLRNSYNPTR